MLINNLIIIQPTIRRGKSVPTHLGVTVCGIFWFKPSVLKFFCVHTWRRIENRGLYFRFHRACRRFVQCRNRKSSYLNVIRLQTERCGWCGRTNDLRPNTVILDLHYICVLKSAFHLCIFVCNKLPESVQFNYS